MTQTNEMNRNLHRLVFFMDRIAEEILQREFKLTFSQFRMLMAIEKHGSVCQSEIAKFHGLTSAAVSRQMDILKVKKLIISTPNSKNRRQHLAKLTPSGKKFTLQAIHLLDSIFDQAFNSLSKTEQREFSKQLQVLLDSLYDKGKDFFCEKTVH